MSRGTWGSALGTAWWACECTSTQHGRGLARCPVCGVYRPPPPQAPITAGELEQLRVELERGGRMARLLDRLRAVPVWLLVHLVRGATWLARRLPRR